MISIPTLSLYNEYVVTPVLINTEYTEELYTSW